MRGRVELPLQRSLRVSRGGADLFGSQPRGEDCRSVSAEARSELYDPSFLRDCGSEPRSILSLCQCVARGWLARIGLEPPAKVRTCPPKARPAGPVTEGDVVAPGRRSATSQAFVVLTIEARNKGSSKKQGKFIAIGRPSHDGPIAQRNPPA